MTDEFLTRFPGTVELTVFAMAFAIGVGIPLGYLAARKHGSWIDSTSVIGSLLGVTIPVFFLAYLLRLVFAVELGWLPGSGRQEVRMDATHITNFYVLDGLLTREWDAAWDALQHLVLPGIALGTIPLAIIVRITRASVLDVVNEDYVRTAQAKGSVQRHGPPPAHPAQRAAAGVDDDRPADGAAALRRRPHRDGVRLRRRGLDHLRRDRHP